MLVHIAIKNLAIVKKVELSLLEGLTAITGETGAGKSIALDALGLCLGDRADSSFVRQGADKAELVAHFDVSALKKAQQFLIDNELQQDDNKDECFIRRVITSEGRSKAFVNGIPVNLTQLKTLGSKLALIHSQHAHYQFLKPEYQAKLLDQYAGHNDLLQNLNKARASYVDSKTQLADLVAKQQQRADRCSLLSYQVQELDDFAIGEDEFPELESEFKKLSNVQLLSDTLTAALFNIKHNENYNVVSSLGQSLKSIDELAEFDASLSPVQESIQSAFIQIEEAVSDLEQYQNHLENDPARVQEIETRYSLCLDLARKHQVKPEDLYQTHMHLAQEYSQLQKQADSLGLLESSLENLRSNYWILADKLSQSRIKSAKRLSKELQDSIREMNLPHAILDVTVKPSASREPKAYGLDDIEIQLSVNPGQKLDVMEKVVSGGELSRIGLAMQVISSKESLIPTMVFDEVDSGISGPTAALVGRLLRKLGTHSQVICVTHLPQVAAQAHHQLFVSKVSDANTTETKLLTLTKQDRVNEIARLLAGDELSESAIANAKDLLSPNFD